MLTLSFPIYRFSVNSLVRELALNLNHTDVLRRDMIASLSLTEKLGEFFTEFVHMKVHFRYHIGPLGKKFCPVNDCSFCKQQNSAVNVMKEQPATT